MFKSVSVLFAKAQVTCCMMYNMCFSVHKNWNTHIFDIR